MAAKKKTTEANGAQAGTSPAAEKVTVIAEIPTPPQDEQTASHEKHHDEKTVETRITDEIVDSESAAASETNGAHDEDMPDEIKSLSVDSLIEQGKAKGSISNAELMEALEKVDYDLEQIEKLYETFGNMGIEVTGYLDDSEIDDEVEHLRSAEDMEKMLTEEGLAIDDPVRMYLKEIGKVPLLDAESELAIAEKIYNGEVAASALAEQIRAQSDHEIDDDEMMRLMTELSKRYKLQNYILDDQQIKTMVAGRRAKEQLVESNLRLVVSIAKRYVGKGMFFLDLIQEGNLGLMKAVEKYDYRKGYKFSTYATWWIRQAITRAIADQARTIRIPVHMVETIHKVSRISRQLLQELGHEASAEEIAAVMDVSPDKVRDIMKIAQEPVSLETPIGEEEDSHLGDFIPDDDSPAPADAASYQLLREQLCEVLHTLTPREEEVLKLRFGLKDGRTRTLEEVGKEFKITRERIRQIEAKALRKLRHPSRSKRLKDYLE